MHTSIYELGKNDRKRKVVFMGHIHHWHMTKRVVLLQCGMIRQVSLHQDRNMMVLIVSALRGLL